MALTAKQISYVYNETLALANAYFGPILSPGTLSGGQAKRDLPLGKIEAYERSPEGSTIKLTAEPLYPSYLTDAVFELQFPDVLADGRFGLTAWMVRRYKIERQELTRDYFVKRVVGNTNVEHPLAIDEFTATNSTDKQLRLQRLTTELGYGSIIFAHVERDLLLAQTAYQNKDMLSTAMANADKSNE